MNTNLILPPQYIDTQNTPVIFLAGPIQGAPQWQAQAIALLQNLVPQAYIASPRKEYLDGTFVYANQVNWETHYLNKAAQSGVVLFWLAKEEVHFPERAYAQTSRFELGEWKVKHERDGINLVVGIEEGFSNARYIKHRLAQDCPKVAICSTLEATCQQAVQLLS